ncbi:hypothetical protein K438DRAFT_1818417 [Mycena galopus ATCC 62051]|nr:hypothetical protein K438DRAFT_1818417 [Mycena galopus ATCC 62051]
MLFSVCHCGRGRGPTCGIAPHVRFLGICLGREYDRIRPCSFAFLQFSHLPLLQPLFRSNHTFSPFIFPHRFNPKLARGANTRSSCRNGFGTLNACCMSFYVLFVDVYSGDAPPRGSQIVGLAFGGVLRGTSDCWWAVPYPSCIQTESLLLKHSVGYWGGNSIGYAAFTLTWALHTFCT